MPNLTALDHLVLTVADIATTVSFYEAVLGMQSETFTPQDGTTRTALLFGAQKINLHQLGKEFEPKAMRATAGSSDLCFLSRTPLEDWQTHFKSLSVDILEGPVPRTGATGPIRSLYLRDPDGNLIEVSNPV